MKKLLFPCFILLSFNFTLAQKEVLFFQTNWGYNGKTIDFIKKAKDSGYDGIEVWASSIPIQQKTISQALKMFDMKVIFLCGSNPNLPYEYSYLP
jgi:tryptophan synthase alpha subunit